MSRRFAPALLLLSLAGSWCFSQPPESKAPPENPPEELTPPRPIGPLSPVLPPIGPVPHPELPGCPPPMVEKTVPYGQVLLVPKEHATTLPRWTVREVEAGLAPGLKVEFTKDRQIVTEMKLCPREVDQLVTCIESKPETVVDPCTGHCKTVWKPCEVVKVVKIKVYEVVPVPREVIVSVPYLKPTPMVVKKLVLEKTTVPAIETTYGVVSKPIEIHTQVPVYPLPPPCAHDPVVPH